MYAHPSFLGLRSQDHFAHMLASGFEARGHIVSVRRPAPIVRRWIPAGRLAKWAGYIDQYLLFPPRLRATMRGDPVDTLYVFCDQALGPWVPLATRRPHVIHCHDLLALRSALGDVPENPTSWSGRLYQRYIRRGFRRGRHFISISQKTRADLHRFGGIAPSTSEVVYNGMNHAYRRLPPGQSGDLLCRAGVPVGATGGLLHVGGGQWYKNTAGVVLLYAHYARAAARDGATPVELWLVGPPASGSVLSALAEVPATGRVRFFSGLDNEALQALYSSAIALLFPSLAEGFGWPIVEALACGCPVFTTDEAPMNEVGGDAATYLPRLRHADDSNAWAAAAAQVLIAMLNRPAAERERRAASGVQWAQRFSADAAIDHYLSHYERVLQFERARLTGV